MKVELAVLRLGYLSQELRARQHTVVKEDDLLKIKEVEPCLAEINRTFNMLGSRLGAYHRTAFVEVKQRIAARHEDQFEERIGLLDEAGVSDAEAQWGTFQDGDWVDLQSLLQGVAESDKALAPWFVIGDHLGDVVFQLLENKLTVSLPPKQWDYLYKGVDSLPEPIRMRAETTFPVHYKSGAHLGLQLVTPLNSLFALLAEEDRKDPYWDASAGKLWYGTTLVKHFTRSAQNQRMALDGFQRQRWINKILNPFRAGHTNLDAAIDACKQTADGLNDGHISPQVTTTTWIVKQRSLLLVKQLWLLPPRNKKLTFFRCLSRM